MLRYANLSLLILYPLAWISPLLRAGLLPFFGTKEISVVSGLVALWKSDVALALLVALLALVAPMAKTLGLAAVQSGRAGRRWMPLLEVLGRLAMADVFLIALYVVIVKGVGLGRVETAWGLYLFTFCVLASIGIGAATKRALARGRSEA
ncbi:paraquat-inducible protein A [Tropicimonas sp. IMCC34043]|uniref:paraquat-inducible protein A n=1 Tax=Tropicimonas sp. IMCC34043 TaxID=2248760 RepID=UPI0018E5033E|nr:paraquat-inducible protein A [Tropicimonas sp. IMCC34043]